MVPGDWDIGPTSLMGPSPSQGGRPIPWAPPQRATSVHTLVHYTGVWLIPNRGGKNREHAIVKNVSSIKDLLSELAA